MTMTQTPQTTTHELVNAQQLAQELGVTVETLGILDQDGDMLEWHDGTLVTTPEYAELFRDQIGYHAPISGLTRNNRYAIIGALMDDINNDARKMWASPPDDPENDDIVFVVEGQDNDGIWFEVELDTESQLDSPRWWVSAYSVDSNGGHEPIGPSDYGDTIETLGLIRSLF